MAKKKQDLSPEERLAAALVPEEEWPYALPDGWKWVRIGKIFIDVTDSQKKIKQKEYLLKGKWPVIDQGQHFIGGYSDADELIYTDKLPVIIFGDHTRNVKYIDFQFIQGADGVKVLKPQSFVYSKFLFWLLKGIPFPSLGYRRHYPVLKKMVAPLPPLDEQQRLVARIESLFTKLDAAKEQAQSVLDSHETRKAALLHDAFAGKLTAKWREERGIPQSWKNGKLLDCLLEKPRNGYSPKAVNYPTKCKSMSLSATTDGIFKKEYYKYIDEEIPADSYLWLEPGDILIQRSNSLEKVGISAIYTGGTHEYIYPDLMMKLQVNNQNDPAYINYFLQRAETRAYFLSNATGIAGNMPKINQKTVSNTPVNYPSLTEQQEIVRILDRLLAREQRARQAAEETLTAIDRMKQSILARAFRGEL